MGRIAHLLVSLACGIGKIGRDGVEIQVGNDDLAAGANVTPFTVSRTLGEWQRNGILTKGRGKLLLRRPELLMDSNKDFPAHSLGDSAFCMNHLRQKGD